ncbi:MAG TPA: CopG family transcriptional regulator [Acidimicrobiia bacterium]|nr:CopG family transcriptional regulator [Acidimicrobiia bacterium]
MARPTSFRLSADLLTRLEAEASATGMTVSALVSELLEEGLRVRRFPGVAFRAGPAGRRAGLVAGPDVWEVIRDVRSTSGRGEAKIRRVAVNAGLTEAQVRLAVDYYSAFPEEIDDRLATEERVVAQLRDQIARRERLTG